MKRILFISYLISCFGIFSVKAQYKQQNSFNGQSNTQRSSRFIYGIGISTFTDFTLTPFIFSSNTTVQPQQIFSVADFTLSFQMNTLLKEFNANKSISLNIAPGFRYTNDITGFVSSSLPVTINYNAGTLSSRNTKSRFGFTFGLGVLFQTTGLIQKPGSSEYGPYVYEQGCFQSGYRYLGRKGRANEINFQVGLGASKTYNAQPNSHNLYPYAPSESITTSYKITFIKYLNY